MLIERVVAPNPGPMTLTGTNTYLLGERGGELAAVDPGPDDLPEHLETVLATAARLGRLTTVIVTHRHLDHLPLAAPLCRATGAVLVGHPDLPGVERPAAHGAMIFDGLQALATPGHTRDSLCLWHAAESALFTGDLVLGTGTAVLDDAPGALSDYMVSLERLRGLRPKTIYPGHGPIVADGVAKLTEYIDHRRQRVQHVIDALRARGPSTPDALASAIYTEIAPNLLPMAARNVRANLEMLHHDGKVDRLDHERWQLTPPRGGT